MKDSTRNLVATIAAGAAQGWLHIESHAGLIRQLTAVVPQWSVDALVTLLLVVITLAVGVVTAPRGAIYALMAFLVGIALWLVLYLRPGPPNTSDVWGYETWGFFILGMVPAMLIATGIGAFGSWLATRRTHALVRAGHR